MRRDNWKLSKSKKLLGIPCEHLKKLNPPHIGGYEIEYRLKNNVAEIWQYDDNGNFRAVIYDKSLVQSMIKFGRMVSGASDEFNKGPEHYLFQFTEAQARDVLKTVGLTPLGQIYAERTGSESTQTDGSLSFDALTEEDAQIEYSEVEGD